MVVPFTYHKVGKGIQGLNGIVNVFGAKLASPESGVATLTPPWTIYDEVSTFDISTLHTTLFWGEVPETPTAPCCEVVASVARFIAEVSTTYNLVATWYYYNPLLGSYVQVFQSSNSFYCDSGKEVCFAAWVGTWNDIWKYQEIFRSGTYKVVFSESSGLISSSTVVFDVVNLPYAETNWGLYKLFVGDSTTVNKVSVNDDGSKEDGPYYNQMWTWFDGATGVSITDFGDDYAEYTFTTAGEKNIGVRYYSSVNPYYTNRTRTRLYVVSTGVSVTNIWSGTVTVSLDISLSVDLAHIDWGDGGVGNTVGSPTPGKTVNHTYSTPGTYTITVVYNIYSGGFESTATTSVEVAIPPVAYLYGVTKTFIGANTYLEDGSVNADETTWEVDNVEVDSGASPRNYTYVPVDYNDHQVDLIASNSGGSDETGVFIKAYDVEFSADKVDTYAMVSIQFSNDCIPETYVWQWDFGDGGTSNEENPTHVYTSNGTYNVSLTVAYPGYIGSTTRVKTGYINIRDFSGTVANFSANVTSGEYDLIVTFTDASTSDYTPFRWKWTFGDGWVYDVINDSGYSTRSWYYNGNLQSASYYQPLFEPGDSVVHTYDTIGVYSVELLVYTESDSDTETKGNYITVLPHTPTVDFSADKLLAYVGNTISFTDETSGETISAWLWNFGDGSTSTDQNPSHVYASVGTYDVSLTVTSYGSDYSLTKTDYITIDAVSPSTRTIFMTPSVDTCVTASYPDVSDYANVGPAIPVGVDENDNDIYYLVKFNLSDIPVGATINSATLRLYHTGIIGDTLYLNLFKAAAAWGSDVTWNTKPSTSTYCGTKTLAVSEDDGYIDYDITSYLDISSATGFIVLPTNLYGLVETCIYTTECVDGTKYPSLIVNYTTTVKEANFYVTKTGGISPLSVSFQDISTVDDITSWSWSFGDSTTSTLQNPSHTYTLPSGVDFAWYDVSLSVVGDTSGSKTKTNYIAVWRDPSETSGDFMDVDFIANVTSGYDSLEVSFTDLTDKSPSKWFWSFGDGGISTLQNPSHTYTTPGVYNVWLNAMGENGIGSCVKEGYIVVSKTLSPPVVLYYADIGNTDVPAHITFMDTGTGATSWVWTFGDGGSANGRSVSHVYTAAGYYTVSCTATGPGGTTVKTWTNAVHVYGCNAITPAIDADVRNGIAPLEVGFTDVSSVPEGVTVTGWLWMFGDGGTSDEQNPEHEYSEGGSYDVTLRLYQGGSYVSKVYRGFVIVKDAKPVPGFSYVKDGNEVTFTNTSSGATSYTWYFGDGEYSSNANPVHIYGSPGVYVIELVARNGDTYSTGWGVIEV